MNNRFIKKIFAVLAILFVLFQSFTLPMVANAQIQPWSGHSWSGTPWEGTPWQGNPWDGSPWEGTPWEGGATDGSDWGSGGTNGQATPVQPTDPSYYEGMPWYLNPWVTSGVSPYGFNGTPSNPLYGGGINGGPVQEGASPATGSVDTKKSDSAKADDPIYSPYDWIKFGVNDVGMSTLQTIAENNVQFSDLGQWNLKSKAFYVNLAENTFKFSTKDIGLLEVGADGIDVAKNYKELRTNFSALQQAASITGTKISPYLSNPRAIVDAAKSIKMSNVVTSASGFAQTSASSFKAMAPLGKLNVVGAAVGAGFSAYDSYQNTVKLFKANTGEERVAAGADLAQSSGSLLMNVGAGVAAFPGGQVVGGALIAGGAALWLAGTAVKHSKTIIETVKHPVKAAKKFGKSVAKKAKKTWKTVKGWFS